MREILEQLAERRAQAWAGGGEKRIKVQHAKGKLTARERIEVLLDEGSFEEFDLYVAHRAVDFGMASQKYPGDGVVTGWGTVNGRTVFVFSKDFLIYLPKDMDPAFLAELDKAVEAVTKNPDFIKDMENLKYTPAFLPSKEAETFIKAKRDSLDGLIKAAPPLDDLTVR